MLCSSSSFFAGKRCLCVCNYYLVLGGVLTFNIWCGGGWDSERERRGRLDDLTKLMINGDTQHASQSNDVFHFLVFSFSVLDNVLYSRCYGPWLLYRVPKAKAQCTFFFLPNCVLPRSLVLSCVLNSLPIWKVRPMLSNYLINLIKKKLIQCKCLVRDNEFVISQSFRRWFVKG